MNILIPSGYRVEIGKLRQHLDEAHLTWWKEWKAQQPDLKVENIRFKHIDGWNRKFFSIQSAHDARHWFWKATRVIWVGMGGSI